MSAFQVTYNHINSICCAILEMELKISSFRTDLERQLEIEKQGLILWNANIESVNTLYPQDRVEPYAKHEFKLNPAKATKLEPAGLIKSLRCLEYQSEEVRDWKNTEAFDIIQTWLRRASEALPGYDDVPWGLPN